MGMTVSGTVMFGKPLLASLASLPSITIAIYQAIIDKTYLTWLDVSKLQAAFPKHVQIMGDTVTLQGPVAIVSSMSPFRRLALQSTAGLVTGLVIGLLISLYFGDRSYEELTNIDGVKTRVATKQESDIRIDIGGVRFSVKNICIAAVSFASAAGAFYFAGRLLPTQAGVYFYKEVPYYA